MRDITSKSNTLRMARAQAIVKVGSEDTLEAVRNKAVPKGDIFEMGKTAGLLAIKRTSDTIPDCHPLPVEAASIDFQIEGLEIAIEVTVKTIYKTGVEVEAMYGASVTAITIYDMLKPLDGEIEIRSTRLLEKKGGKSDYRERFPEDIEAAVIVCSDSVSSGRKKDRAGKELIEKLELQKITVSDYIIIPDEQEEISGRVSRLAEVNDIVIITGGTGLSPRDVTPEAIRPLLDREIPGISEVIRSYGQERTPYAMLSRSVTGLIGDCLVMALPGSTRGASESMDAVFPYILHIFKVMKAVRHD